MPGDGLNSVRPRSVSSTTTVVAAAPPALLTTIVMETDSPNATIRLLTLIASDRSALVGRIGGGPIAHNDQQGRLSRIGRRVDRSGSWRGTNVDGGRIILSDRIAIMN